MRIIPGDLGDPQMRALLTAHLTQCRAESPPGSAHALDLSGLAAADIDLFAGYEGAILVAVGALRRLGAGQGEVKSMHTLPARRGQGYGADMLAHLLAHARESGLTRLSLETGGQDFFHPARRLYRRAGFRDTVAFANYRADPSSRFLTLDLGGGPRAAETRAAREADLPAMLEIYNHVIATSTAVYRDEPVPLDERAAWFAARTKAGFPVLVAERAGEVLGFASYGDWRGAFPGYARTVEHSVHVGERARGLGLGAALMAHLLDLAREAGLHAMVGAVDADNAGSRKFHARLGFREAGHFHEVGRKFGRWLDLVFVEKVLG